MLASRAKEQVSAALAAVDGEAASTEEKVGMLTELAMGLQTRPRSPDDLHAAVRLYETALGLLGSQHALERARITARMGTALQAIPSQTSEHLERARDCFESVRDCLAEHGKPEEVGELDMNLGLVQQALASAGLAPINEAISCYQRALRTFEAKAHPKEFAILQNNLATAFLSIPFSDERAKMREALAVQSFEEGLKVVNLIDHPSEYAMLQNNLGNALQYASSSHAVENNLRALEAYDEALKVRTREAAPLEYANTIANKANCLLNLPDDPEAPEKGNATNLAAARKYYESAVEIFSAHGEDEKVRIVGDVLSEMSREQLASAPQDTGNGAPANTCNGASTPR